MVTLKKEAHIKRKLCYILLNYSEKTDRHYYHLYSFINKLAEKYDLCLIIKEANGKPNFQNVSEIRVNQQSSFVRLWLFKEILRAYFRGYHLFYCHYTFIAAIFASILTRFLGGGTYFWHCIMLDVLLKEHNLSLISPGGLIFMVGSRFIEHFVTGSYFMKKYYMDTFKIPFKRIEVLPNYINIERFTPNENDKLNSKKTLNLPLNVPVVLFVHGLEKGKGGSRLVPIAQSIIADFPQTLFLVVGDGSERPLIEEEIIQSNLSNSFILYGSVPNNEISIYYKAADIFIMPSLYEEFSRTLLEAMATGIPFVATDGMGGTYSYTTKKQHEFIVPSKDLNEFCNRLKELLKDPELREKLANEGLNYVQNFSQSAIINKFISNIT